MFGTTKKRGKRAGVHGSGLGSIAQFYGDNGKNPKRLRYGCDCWLCIEDVEEFRQHEKFNLLCETSDPRWFIIEANTDKLPSPLPAVERSLGWRLLLIMNGVYDMIDDR